ncbi:MAG: hypothetical protein WAO23_07175 [Dethiobacteria bacterium]
MRTAVLILGVIAMIMNLSQSISARFGGKFLEEPSLFHGGNAGALISIAMGVASIMALFKPFISMVIFAVAGIVSVVLGIFMDYYEMIFWGVISLALAGLCYSARKEVPSPESYEESISEDFIKKL